MGDTSTAVAIATVVSAVIAALTGWLTNKAANKAAVRNTDVASRTDIEKEAFDRADAFLRGALDRQDKEIARQDGEITELHSEVDELKVKVRKLESTEQEQLEMIAVRDAQIRALSVALAAHGGETLGDEKETP